MQLDHLRADLILLDFDTPWEWRDFYHWIDQLHVACQQVNGPVSAIVRHQHPLPTGNAMRHFLKVEALYPANLKRVGVVFRPDDLLTMQTMFRVMTTIQPMRHQIVSLHANFETALMAMNMVVER
jgi:hypothetical protein